jgi:hypothetical protein
MRMSLSGQSVRKCVVGAAVLAVVCLLALGAAAGDKKKPAEKFPKDKFASVKFVVVKDKNGKPVRSASVILHAVNEDGEQEKGGLQLKTDQEGVTKYDGIPYGRVRVQVIARGLQTYGEDIVVNQPEVEMNIRMKPPQDQVTIYEKK